MSTRLCCRKGRLLDTSTLSNPKILKSLNLIRDKIHRCDVDVATIFGKLFPSEAIIRGAVMVMAQLVAHQAAMTSA
jgi:hypothetical protein